MKSLENSALKPDLVMGYTTKKHLLLDFDNTNLFKLSKIIHAIMKEFPEVGDALIMTTNDNNYQKDLQYDRYQRPRHKIQSQGFHAIFDNLIGYNKACMIIEILAALRIINKDYSDIRRFRGDMTLRITPKVLKYSFKDYPKFACTIENKYKKKRDGYISRYTLALGLARCLRLPNFYSEDKTHDCSDSANYGA